MEGIRSMLEVVFLVYVFVIFVYFLSVVLRFLIFFYFDVDCVFQACIVFTVLQNIISTCRKGALND